MLLLEITYSERNKDLDYLAEYLIENKGVTLKEAKELIRLVEEEKQGILKKVLENGKKKLAALNTWRADSIKKAKLKYTGSALDTKLKDIEVSFRSKRWNIKHNMEVAGKNAGSRANRAKATIGAAYKTMPKKGKIGIAAAGGLAVGGGIAAFSARKKRKAALDGKK